MYEGYTAVNIIILIEKFKNAAKIHEKIHRKAFLVIKLTHQIIWWCWGVGGGLCFQLSCIRKTLFDGAMQA